jgi:hypothetical protein
MSRILHLEGGEFCGSTKQKVDMPLKSIWDSHVLDHVKFSHLKMEIIGIHFNAIVGCDHNQTSQKPC